MTPGSVERFCREHFGDSSPEKLAGDASTRRFYRVRSDAGSRILMDTGAPFDPERDPFLRSAGLLASLGLPVPAIVEVFPAEGMILMEDLGDLLLQRRLIDCPDDERDRLYEGALDQLVLLHTQGTLVFECLDDHPARGLALDRNRLLFELDFALEHFVEGLRRATVDAGDRAVLRESFDALATEVASFGAVLCHRDYHARNLIVRHGELAIIDFQDARWGPVTYDVASLLLDSYTNLPPRRVDGMVEIFRRRILQRIDEITGKRNMDGDDEPSGAGPTHGVHRLAEVLPSLRDPVEFRRRFDLTCLQRNIKALGTFGFQATVHGNRTYLRYVDKTVRNVRRNLVRFPDFAPAARILEALGALRVETGGV